ncbi:UNVERIFIED_CONTAM: hypothetical protein Cloal_0547 [Acetivibrio alkalicellulosi]
MRKIPFFKYHPEPLKTGMIKKETTTCEVCEKEIDYIYNGPFYAEEEVSDICPWCIKDGKASKEFDGTFQDEDSCDPVDKEEYVDELIHRTPGYGGWQQEYWLSHCGDFCSFEGFVGWSEIEGIINDLEDDISESGFTKDDLQRILVNGGSLQGYLFKCNICGKYRIHFDCD